MAAQNKCSRGNSSQKQEKLIKSVGIVLAPRLPIKIRSVLRHFRFELVIPGAYFKDYCSLLYVQELYSLDVGCLSARFGDTFDTPGGYVNGSSRIGGDNYIQHKSAVI